MSNVRRAALRSEVGVEGMEVEESEGPSPLALDLRMDVGLALEFSELVPLRLEGRVLVVPFERTGLGFRWAGVVPGRLTGPGLAVILALGLGLAPGLVFLEVQGRWGGRVCGEDLYGEGSALGIGM